MKQAIKLWLANLVGFIVANPFVMVAGVILLITIICLAMVQKSCESRKIEKLGNNANHARDNSLVIEGEINADNRALQNSLEQRNAVNGNVNQVMQNLSNARNGNYKNTTGSQLDKLAEDYK